MQHPNFDTAWLGQTFHYFKSIDSTNRYLGAYSQQLPHGTVAVTGFQSAGRGRLGRTWHAPPGTCLLFSILLKPNWPAEQSGWLPMIAGLAAQKTLGEISQIEIGLKWPNDVVIQKEDGVHKMGGILLEGGFEGEKLTQAIIGIGLNINLTEDQLPPQAVTRPTSLRLETGRMFEIATVLETLCGSFEPLYGKADHGRSPHELWQENLVTIGQEVTVRQGETVTIGRAVGCDRWGGLQVKDEKGDVLTFSSADVSLRG